MGLPDAFGFESWSAFYQDELQAVWALLPVPLLFVLWRVLRPVPPNAGAEASAAPFMERYAVAFGILTMVDPLVTGVLARVAGLGEASGTALMLLFVLLGDWRVFVLLERLWGRESRFGAVAQRAALWTCVVPVLAFALYRLLRVFDPELPAQALWLVYESLFVGLALTLRARLSRRETLQDKPALQGYLRLVLAYVAVYYGLWALSDVLILSGQDFGWALRLVPNQLYYAFYVPFVWLAFFSGRYAVTPLGLEAR